MFTLPAPINLVSVQNYVSDEVHITGKAARNPQATLSFVAVDINGNRVHNAPVAIVTLTGAAFNTFNANWQNETDLYSVVLSLVLNNTPGCAVSGVDIAQVISDLTATASQEVVADPAT